MRVGIKREATEPGRRYGENKKVYGILPVKEFVHCVLRKVRSNTLQKNVFVFLYSDYLLNHMQAFEQLEL